MIIYGCFLLLCMLICVRFVVAGLESVDDDDDQSSNCTSVNGGR